METVVWIVHVLAAGGVIGLVLLQHGKGADMGAAFGSGASGSLFGASGSANFLSRATAALAAVFFLTSLGLAYFSNGKSKQAGAIIAPRPAQTAPATTPAAPAAPGSQSLPSKAGEIPK